MKVKDEDAGERGGDGVEESLVRHDEPVGWSRLNVRRM
jgi:hypothetical protein